MESTKRATNFLLLKTIHTVLFTITVYPLLVLSITVTTHDKPSEIKLSLMRLDKSSNVSYNGTLAASERQKRLLPYYNFYMGNGFNQPSIQNQNNQKYQLVVPKATNQQPYLIKYGDIRQQQQIKSQDNHLLYQPKEKFTPFLESNALPGPFVPMTRNQNENIEPPATAPQYALSQPRPDKPPPNYGALYDKLSQLKLLQPGISSRPESYSQNIRINNPKHIPQKISYIPLREYQENNIQYKPIQPTKTYLHTYTATNIDIPSNSNQQYIPQYQTAQKAIYKPYLKQIVESPHQDHVKPITPEEQQQYLEDQQKFTEATKTPLRKPIIILQSKPINPQQPIQIYEERPNNKQIIYINDKGYGIPIQKYTPIPVDNYEPIQKYQYVPYEKPEYQNVLTTAPPPTYVENPNQNSIGQILKQLQDTNTLPQTLTPENIDNSIKTLVKILTALKKQSKFSKPIVVTDENNPEYDDTGNNEAEVNTVQPVEIQGGSVTQIFPANTPDGGTPGKPGVDYPNLSNIPKTTFNCKTQRYKGFFGDPDTNCQVWHYCDLNGGQASFLCPNGTIFSQVALTCDWWYNVKCSSTAQLYVLNERLYKYILPLSPKFPEDYSGPLVDKYLALKFKEMEEKMRKQKKGKQPPPPEEIIQKGIDDEIITEEALEHNETKKYVEELSNEETEETTNTTISNEN